MRKSKLHLQYHNGDKVQVMHLHCGDVNCTLGGRGEQFNKVYIVLISPQYICRDFVPAELVQKVISVRFASIRLLLDAFAPYSVKVCY